MRFWTWIPLFILLQFSLCGQQDPVIPDPGYLTVTAQDTEGTPILDVRIDLQEIEQAQNAPATFEVVAGLPQQVRVSKTGWVFAPVDTTVTLAEGEELELVFVGVNVQPGEVTVRAVDGEDAAIPGVTVSVDGEAEEGSAPLTVVMNPDVPFTLSVEASGWIFAPADTSITLDPGAETEVVFVGTALSAHLVLVEDFSNTGCGPCPAADEAMWEAVGQASGAAMPIAFHGRFPFPGDPFYLYNTVMNVVRSEMFYGIFALPNVRVDGVPMTAPSASEEILSAIESRLAVPPSIEFVVTREQAGPEVTVNVEGSVIGEVPADDWRIYLLLIETFVHYEEASNGQTEYRNTVRHVNGEEDAIASGLGESIDLSPGAEFSVSATFTPDFGDVVAENLRAVVFVQNSNTFEILDAAVEVTGGP